MFCNLIGRSLAVSVLLVALGSQTASAEIVIAEGERFQPEKGSDWKVTHQEDSYGSHTYGGMWMTHGGCLGAPADSEGAVARQTVTIPATGKYRVWSKYQAPPYFNYLHKIEIVQGGKTVYSYVYGKVNAERLWSFSGTSNELWWPWGIDHDAAEAPKQMVNLAKGKAEIRLVTVPAAKPAGDRFIDFVVLTTNPADDYQGYKPYAVGSPFTNEAFAATRLYMRFKNTSSAPARLGVRRAGHYQPQYGGSSEQFPESEVAAGQWSPWFNIGPFCRLVHDEGLWLTLAGASQVPVQIARDSAGKQLVGDLTVPSGEAISIPIDITWREGARVLASREHAKRIIALSKSWRKAGGGKKPQGIFYYGAFRGQGDWIPELKHALGYNTQLPPKYPGSPWDGFHGHVRNAAQITAYAKNYNGDKKYLRFVSFGDEIGLGRINFKDPANLEKFRGWLKAKGVTAADLGMNPAQATLETEGNPRLVWYSNLFNEEERFADFRARTELVKKELGPHVLAGANYSPHHLALCYGPIFQWVDIFKHNGMSMFWAEDYIFSVPETPQIISWMFGQMRCATKYNHQPIHFYVMPHAPGQTPGMLRRNMLAAVGFGARHIDNFWVAPEENFTENYVSWNYPETFRTISEAIYDSAEAETLQVGGRVRPARVAVITGKATDFNESRLMVEKATDPFGRRCRNAPEKMNQIICRKDQQMLYLALVHAGHAVDLVTEDDIAELDVLKKYDAVYFAGEWIDTRAVEKLDAWVQGGGVLYATAGIGHLNQFGQREPAMEKLLGLKGSTLRKNVAVIRTLLELPLLPAIDTITLGEEKIPVVGMRQQLSPGAARVLGTWSDGSPAVTVHEYGKGKAFAVGTLAGNSYMKTAVRVQPWPRGGRKQVYNPVDFDPAATKLVRLGIDAKDIPRAAITSQPLVEAVVMDHPKGTLVTLLNWTNEPQQALEVSVQLPAAPKTVRTVSGQKSLDAKYADGRVTFTTDLAEADYILLLK